MAFDTNQFRAQFAGNYRGFSSPALFEVWIHTPKILLIPDRTETSPAGRATGISFGGDNTTQDKINTQKYTFLCDTASIPGRTMNTTQFRSYGQPKTIVDAVYQDSPLQVSIIATRNLVEHGFIDRWQESMNSQKTGDVGYYDDYKSKVEVVKYSQTGAPEKAYIYTDAYPVSIAPVSLSWDAMNQFIKFNVIFSYRKWELAPDVAVYDTRNAALRLQEQVSGNIGTVSDSINSVIGRI